MNDDSGSDDDPTPAAFGASFLTSLIDNLADPVFVKDEQHRWIVLNDAFCRFMGRPREELLGKSDYDFSPKAEADVFWAKDQLVFETGEGNTNEEAHTNAAGEQHTISTKKARFFDAEGKAYLVGVIRDVTDAKRVQEELRAARDAAEAGAREKSLFLANVSHELRTPLNAVIGMSGLLLGTPLSTEQQDYARTIRASSDALLGLINNVLDFSKAEAGKLELERVPVCLAKCLDAVLLLVAARARSKGLELRSKVGPRVPAWVEGDPTRIQQVLINLLSNATKFTEQGHVGVSITSPVRAEVVIEVSDTGPGISPQRRAQLFEPFSQGDASTTRRYGGTGLGLAISRRLCALMGGTLRVESTLGEGATFVATFAAPQTGAPAHESGKHERSALPALRILVAEDNLVNQRVAVAMLGKLGFVPTVVADGMAVLAAFEQEDYDLVLMDVQMPKLDGREATRRLRAELPAQRQPRIVAVTASALEGDREACLESGMDAYLTKPLRSEVLRRVLSETTPLDEPA